MIRRRGWIFLLCCMLLAAGLLPACDVEEEEVDTVVPGPPNMEFRLISAGTFQMGSPTTELNRSDDEILHEVTIATDFYLQTTEVTQAQWEEVMGYNPSANVCAACPVENVSWSDVQAFVTALSEDEEGDYRLPTEAEWEYAARAGGTLAFANGDLTELTCEEPDDNLDEMGWFRCNSGDASHAVAGKDVNEFGVYDMHGNVYEWVADWYGAYPATAEIDPTGPATGDRRVARGGAFDRLAHDCRAAARLPLAPTELRDNLGFRLVWVP